MSGHQVHREIRANARVVGVRQVLRVHKEQLEIKAHKEIRVISVLQVSKEFKDQQVSKESQVI
jgi:hypothetical protein